MVLDNVPSERSEVLPFVAIILNFVRLPPKCLKQVPHILGIYFLDTQFPFLYIQPTPKRVFINSIGEKAD